MSRFVQKREGDEVWDACHLASQMGVRVPSLWARGGGGGGGGPPDQNTHPPHLTSPPLPSPPLPFPFSFFL
jgi:hypothetical protein